LSTPSLYDLRRDLQGDPECVMRNPQCVTRGSGPHRGARSPITFHAAAQAQARRSCEPRAAGYERGRSGARSPPAETCNPAPMAGSPRSDRAALLTAAACPLALSSQAFSRRARRLRGGSAPGGATGWVAWRCGA